MHLIFAIFFIDINECEMGFHDCHENANCVNINYRFDCQCKTGFQALGRTDDVLANGRECPGKPQIISERHSPSSIRIEIHTDIYWEYKWIFADDDECNLGICPFTADCENTYGSFICHCKDGFRKTAPTICEGQLKVMLSVRVTQPSIRY